MKIITEDLIETKRPGWVPGHPPNALSQKILPEPILTRSFLEMDVNHLNISLTHIHG